MSKKDPQQDLQLIFSQMDEWFKDLGSMSIKGHAELKRLLKESIPAAKDIKYEVNLELQRVQVTIFVGTFVIFFGKPRKLAAAVLEILEECLPDFKISVDVKRFKNK